MLRGVLWFGLYLVLTLAPLVIASMNAPAGATRPFVAEFGIAIGFVAFAIIAIEFALVARLHIVAEPFGIDVLMLFHRRMGIAALAFAAAHPLLLIGNGVAPSMLQPFTGKTLARSGAVALWAIAILVVGSLQRKRWRLRYESWRTVHALLAIAAMAAMLVHVLAVGGYGAALPLRILLIGYVALFTTLLVRYRLVRPMLLWRRPWQVTANREEGGDTRTLVMQPIGHSGFEFEPGQFAWLITGRTPFSLQHHPLTISSSAVRGSDGAIELTIKALGDWSRAVVPEFAAGSRAWIDGPFGAFTIDRAPAQGFVMIAGGIGITPMRSMLLSMRDRGDERPVVLIYAARNSARAIFATELEELARDSRLSVVYVFEEPRSHPRCEQGFVDAELLRRHLPTHCELWQFFVCGPGAMMDAVERALAELDIPAARVHTERFDMV